MEQENERLEYKVFTRIGKSKFDELSGLLENSPYRTMSSLIRNILVNGKITILTHDASLDNVMEKLCRVQAELQRIGININQVTRKIHLTTLPQDQMDILLEATKFNQQANRKVEELLQILYKLAEKWLPE